MRPPETQAGEKSARDLAHIQHPCLFPLAHLIKHTLSHNQSSIGAGQTLNMQIVSHMARQSSIIQNTKRQRQSFKYTQTVRHVLGLYKSSYTWKIKHFSQPEKWKNLESNWRLIHYYFANKRERFTSAEEWLPRYFENKFSIKCPGKHSKKFCVYLRNFLDLQQSFTTSVVQLICRSFFKVVHWSLAYFVKRKVSQQIKLTKKTRHKIYSDKILPVCNR